MSGMSDERLAELREEVDRLRAELAESQKQLREMAALVNSVANLEHGCECDAKVLIIDGVSTCLKCGAES